MSSLRIHHNPNPADAFMQPSASGSTTQPKNHARRDFLRSTLTMAAVAGSVSVIARSQHLVAEPTTPIAPLPEAAPMLLAF